MDSLYFFTGITVLSGVVIYAIHCVNKTSYLHDPFRLPSIKGNSGETTFRSAAPRELTRPQPNMTNTVDWYTHRHASTRSLARKAEPAGTPYQVREHLKERKEEPEVFVGMAVLHEQSEASANEGREKNIDRWFRQAAANQ